MVLLLKQLKKYTHGHIHTQIRILLREQIAEVGFKNIIENEILKEKIL